MTIEQIKELLRNKVLVLITGIIVILLIISLYSLKETNASSPDYKFMEDNATKKLADEKKNNETLTKGITSLGEKQKKLTANQQQAEDKQLEIESIENELNSLIDENKEISFKRMDDYTELDTTDLTKKEMFEALTIATGKTFTEKDYKAITDSSDIEGYLKGKDNNYSIRKVYGDNYLVMLETKKDNSLVNVYVVNTKTKKVELNKSYQDIKVDIDEDY
ncbi:hypothetical protein [Vagococcus fluvialis]|uniref:hypothetical protein n=1 Tax=Vagococcus fluvialis TaxID=2738 RepID=UPI003B5C80D7